MEQILQTPRSFLHNSMDPSVSVRVNSVCGKGECETQMRQEVQEMMDKVVAEGGGRMSEPSLCVKAMACRICVETGRTMSCGRCRVAAYCGKEYQTMDWEAHKKSCVSKHRQAEKCVRFGRARVTAGRRES